MFEILKQLAADKNISDKQLLEMSNGFSLAALLTLVAATKEKFTDQDQTELQELIKQKNFDQTLQLLQSKHSKEEWDALIEKQLVPLFDGFAKSVFAV